VGRSRPGLDPVHLGPHQVLDYPTISSWPNKLRPLEDYRHGRSSCPQINHDSLLIGGLRAQRIQRAEAQMEIVFLDITV
jgi:hypothetical protein